ncbi:MAG: hypothetical protein K5945_01085 [Bacteroidaceae bacterium]|nr:hypothetical protein [Bacteroidaceae bacterium]
MAEMRTNTEKKTKSLVETDAETGQTSLRIPVPDKQTVRNLLDIVGKLYSLNSLSSQPLSNREGSTGGEVFNL